MTDVLDTNKNYEIYDEDSEFRTREIAEFANANTPKGAAIIVLMAKPGEDQKIQFFFISNMPRPEMLELIRSYLASEEAKDEEPKNANS